MSQKPEIVTMDPGGYHNSDLAKTTQRIIEGGSWKRQRCVVVIPSADMIPAKVALSHWSLMFPPNQPVHRMLALGCEVGIGYSTAIEEVLAHPDLRDFEYLVTLEHDSVVPPDAVLRLIQRIEQRPEFSCISGLYYTKGYNGCAQIWGTVQDPVLNFRPQPPDPAGGLVECNGVGMGTAVFKLSMFKDEKLRRPWFKTLTGIEGQGVGTQDLYAWGDFKKYGYRCAVDCSVRCGHMDFTGAFGPKDMIW